MTDFKDILPEQLGWSNIFTSANAKGLAKLLTDCIAFNPDQDTAGIIWERILPSVPVFDWRRFKSTGYPYATMDVLPAAQFFDVEKIISWTSAAAAQALGIALRLQLSQGCCARVRLSIEENSDKMFIAVSASDHTMRNNLLFPLLIQLMGMERFADFKPEGVCEEGKQKVHFRVHSRIAGAFALGQLGDQWVDNEGKVSGYFSFYCSGREKIASFLRDLETSKEIACLKVDKIGLYRVPLNAYEQAASLLKAYGTKECVLQLGCLGKDTCQITPPDLAVEMEKYDLITLGFLGGPGLPKSRDVPRFVCERLLSVDMVREDGGWSFCLTSLERELSQKYRDRLNEYLNTELGFPFITRSPKERWKELLKHERQTIL
jgi:hypothetical protein